MTIPGTRVLAVRDSDGEHLHVYGEGEYVGDRPRPMNMEEETEIILGFLDYADDLEEARQLFNHFRLNPCINLDNGYVVWGFQCWWGPVEKVQRRFPESQYDYISVPVPEENERWTDD